MIVFRIEAYDGNMWVAIDRVEANTKLGALRKANKRYPMAKKDKLAVIEDN